MDAQALKAHLSERGVDVAHVEDQPERGRLLVYLHPGADGAEAKRVLEETGRAHYVLTSARVIAVT